jgi:dihydrofolate reductase
MHRSRQGGVRFARALVAAGLVDEYRLVVHPVVLGVGERLFDAPPTIEPTTTEAFSQGAVAHVVTAANLTPEPAPGA